MSNINNNQLMSLGFKGVELQNEFSLYTYGDKGLNGHHLLELHEQSHETFGGIYTEQSFYILGLKLEECPTSEQLDYLVEFMEDNLL